MIVTTTNNIDGYEIVEYTEIVFGEVIAGINFFKDFSAGLSDIFGGRSSTYEKELQEARNQALMEIKDRASLMNADGIVGLKMDYEMLGSSNNMMMVTCSGTAVKLKAKNPN